MRRHLGGAVVATAAVLLVAGPAAAQEEFDTKTQYSHKGQVGIHALVGTGYRVLFPYDEEFCGELDDDEPVNSPEATKAGCTGRAPLFLDLGLGYGLTESVEMYLEIRLGLESDFGADLDSEGPKHFHFAGGFKYYVRDVGLTKFFTSLAFFVDTTDYPCGAVYQCLEGNDLGVRNVNGLQFDLHKTVGVFFFFGPTIGFKRALRFDIDGGLGIQARFP